MRLDGALARALHEIARSPTTSRKEGDVASLRAALSVLVRLLLLPEKERRKTGETAALDAAIARRFPDAPPRVAGRVPDAIPESARSLETLPVRELALAFGELLGSTHRKRGGSFFTPPVVARALARGTLSPLLEEKNGRGALPVVLDPAAGAGALLEASAAFLLERVGRGRRERERIAERLVGIDVDPDAVLLARALLREALGFEPRVLHGDALATRDLARAHPTGTLAPPCEPRTLRELEPSEGPLAVVGNPPFLASYARGAVAPDEARAALLAARFPGLRPGEGNAFLRFLALALETAEERQGSRIGLVLPDALLTNERYERSRRDLVARSSDVEALVLDWPAFGRASVRTALVLATIDGKEARSKKAVRVSIFRSPRAVSALEPDEDQTASRRSLEARPAFSFPRGATDLALEAKIRKGGVPLAELCWVRDGINPGPRSFREAVISPIDASESSARGPFVFPCLEGKDVRRYRVLEPRLLVRADPSLLSPELKRRGASFRESWIFDQEKLLSRQTSPTLVLARDERRARALNSLHAIGRLETTPESLLYVLAVLSSAPLRWYYARTSGETRKVFPQVHVAALRRLPVPRATGERRAAHDELSSLARALEACPEDRGKNAEVDRLVADLLGLTRREAGRVAGEAPPLPVLLE